MDIINWDNLELVVFDVDGTLYDQSVLRKKIAVALLKYYAIRPWKFNDLLILFHFRKEREKKAGYAGDDLESRQYEWCALKTRSPVEKIRKVTAKWIFDFPNRYLEQAMYPGVKDFFRALENKKILTAIYSDYAAGQKMKEMRLNSKILVSSTDANINAFKPQPVGLNCILTQLKIKNKANCLFIGDRQDLDGHCAELAGIPFLLVNKEAARIDFYERLLNKMN